MSSVVDASRFPGVRAATETRTGPSAPTTPSRPGLSPATSSDVSRRGVSVLRRRPPAPLSRLVDRVWHVSWALEHGQQVAPEVVLQPAVTLTFEQGEAVVTGLGSLRFRRELVGRGRALGVVFRPGCFRPLLGRSVQTLTERSVPASEVFGPSVDYLAEELSHPRPLKQQVAVLADYFAPMIPAERTSSEIVADLVHLMVTDPDMTGVGDLSRRVGVSRRRLQRLFAEHVGVGPKWVLDRRHVPHGLTLGTTQVPQWEQVASELAHRAG